jgi:hypothetical protein
MPNVNMFKGDAARAIDEWYATGDIAANLREAQTFLASGAKFVNVVSALVGRGRSKPEFQYPSGAVQGDQFEAVAREAYLQGIALAQRHAPPIPISTFWVAGQPDYEAHAVDGDQAVTVTLVVPVAPPPDPPTGPESWAVELSAGQPVVRQMSGPANATRPWVGPTAAS